MLGGNIVNYKRVCMVWNSGWRVRSSGTRDRLEQPSCCPAGLGLIRISSSWVLSVCVLVCMRDRVWVFVCTSWEAQWAGADALSSHSNSPNRVCYLWVRFFVLLAFSLFLSLSHLAFQPGLLRHCWSHIHIRILQLPLQFYTQWQCPCIMDMYSHKNQLSDYSVFTQHWDDT